MEFELSAIFKRSVTIEIKNDLICYARCGYSVLVNGEVVLKDNRNVVSVFGLQPDTDYAISIIPDDKDQGHEVHFTTKHESVLLDVTRFGAKGDGVTPDTSFLQSAIMSCPEDGTVFVPKGRYFTAPLFMKSHMTLWLDKDAVLVGDPDRQHYPYLPGLTDQTDGKDEYNLTSWEGNPETSFASLITGIGVTDFDLVGEGTVDGGGSEGDWWQDAKTLRIAWRPNTIFLNHCTDIRLQGVTVQNSPSWTIHPYYTDHMSVYNITIQNPPDSPNTDGFDPESCEDILILGTRISVGDDCVAIKSGKYYMSDKHHKPAHHFIIRNSFLERGHGSVTVGSEAAGGVTDVSVSQCIFDSTDRGLRIKTRRGRGPKALYDDISFHDIIMKDVAMPFTFNMFYFCDPDGHCEYVQKQQALPVDDKTPCIGTVTAENITCTGIEGSLLCAYGLPEMPIKNIVIKNIEGTFKRKKDRPKRQILMMDNFPEMTGVSFYARNIEHLTIEDVTVTGADDFEPEIKDVIEYDSKRVIYNQ